MVAFIFRINRTEKPCILQEELAACKKGLYSKLHTILRLLMIGPVPSATVEGSNSSLRFVKSCFGITMREDRLNALSLLFIYKDVALDYDVIIDDYAKRNKRRMTFINLMQWIYLWLVLESYPWDAFPLLNFFNINLLWICVRGLDFWSQMTKAPKTHAVNILLKQTGFDNFSGIQCCWLCWEVVLPP